MLVVMISTVQLHPTPSSRALIVSIGRQEVLELLGDLPLLLGEVKCRGDG